MTKHDHTRTSLVAELAATTTITAAHVASVVCNMVCKQGIATAVPRNDVMVKMLDDTHQRLDGLQHEQQRRAPGWHRRPEWPPPAEATLRVTVSAGLCWRSDGRGERDAEGGANHGRGGAACGGSDGREGHGLGDQREAQAAEERLPAGPQSGASPAVKASADLGRRKGTGLCTWMRQPHRRGLEAQASFDRITVTWNQLDQER